MQNYNELLSALKKYDLRLPSSGRSLIVSGTPLAQSAPLESFLDAFPSIVSSPQGVQLLARHRASIVPDLREHLKSTQTSTIHTQNLYYDSSMKFPFQETKVLVDPKKMKSFILYNELSEDYIEVSPKYLERVVKLPKGINHSFINIKETFNPTLPTGFYELDESDQEEHPNLGEAIWNHYRSPEYLSLAPNSENLHPAMAKFFDHLTVNVQSQEHIYNWLHTLLFDFENPCPILVLCGKAAIGKNTLVESIMSSLVGHGNMHKAAQLSERFNSSIANCILHFSDEGEVSGIIKRNLKGFHELFVAIERKGQDVTSPERIYARFVVATNNRRDLKLDANDRKFSLPELCDTKLLESLTEEDAKYLFNFRHDLQEQRNLAHWLQLNFKGVNQEAYHGTLFEQICYESLPNWFRSFLKMLDMGEEFTFRQYKKRIDLRNLAVDTLLHEIEQYEHQTGISIVDYVNDEGVDTFTPKNILGGLSL